MEEGGAKMEQCNDKTNKLDEIHGFCTKFVRISYEFHIRFVINTQSFT